MKPNRPGEAQFVNESLVVKRRFTLNFVSQEILEAVVRHSRHLSVADPAAAAASLRAGI